MKAWLVAALVSGCVTTPPARPVPPPTVPTDDRYAEQRAVLDAFLVAVQQNDFAGARELLCRPLRERYDAARLQRDFEAEPLARERVRRLASHRAEAFEVKGDAATLSLGDGRALRLVRDADAWRIAALE